MQIVFDNTTVQWADEVRGHYSYAFEANQFYEQDMLDHIRSLSLGGVYLDIGASLGNHTIFFALFCPSRKVLSFEPVARARRLLRKHVALNGVSEKVVILENGLGEKKGEYNWDRRGEIFTISIMAFDEQFPGISDVSIVKIDVEGLETAVIRGAQAMISKCKPILFVEASTPDAFDRLTKEMKQLGYNASGMCFKGTPTYEFLPEK